MSVLDIFQANLDKSFKDYLDINDIANEISISKKNIENSIASIKKDHIDIEKSIATIEKDHIDIKKDIDQLKKDSKLNTDAILNIEQVNNSIDSKLSEIEEWFKSNISLEKPQITKRDLCHFCPNESVPCYTGMCSDCYFNIMASGHNSSAVIASKHGS